VTPDPLKEKIMVFIQSGKFDELFDEEQQEDSAPLEKTTTVADIVDFENKSETMSVEIDLSEFIH